MPEGAGQPSPFHLNFLVLEGLGHAFSSGCLLSIQGDFLWMSISLLGTPACHRLLVNFWVLSNQERVLYKQLPSLSSRCSPLLISPLLTGFRYAANKQLETHLTST